MIRRIAALVLQQPISPRQKTDLVAFLKSLTDERVRWEKAPFDHPQLRVPHGHSAFVDPNNLKQAEDLYLTVPAIGKKGRVDLGPIRAFESYLKPKHCGGLAKNCQIPKKNAIKCSLCMQFM
ncbi:hypothetical protein CRENPOLYSF2_200003 [Crenothrix polyspora]|uniref:Uncharacterized protein n=1 Tax=Crenothrix polyspora TaxID=360316 RepID=A0A1R4H457_9GAMM|nr:hypothetical protein [Crenothrix polyspora]SJM91043.1 hypothetical protein CRENPOLYSF2_200003 [Crenothrix polyspora]